jgi:hypothetical protein
MLKSSQAISHINVEIKTNVSGISSLFIIRVNVVNGHIYQSLKSMPHPFGILCSERTDLSGKSQEDKHMEEHATKKTK